jgi:NitT/TauT family transport system permease protein
MTDATINIANASFRPGTSDAEIEAAAARAATYRRRTVIFWRLAILIAFLGLWEIAARMA